MEIGDGIESALHDDAIRSKPPRSISTNEIRSSSLTFEECIARPLPVSPELRENKGALLKPILECSQ